MKNDLFRKEALEGIASPEKVNEYIHVSSISSFVILGALFLFMIAAIVWGIFGHVSENVKIKGIIFPFEGTQSITLPEDGVVRDLYVERGDYVKEGDQLGLLSVGEQFSLLTSPQKGIVLSRKERSSSFAAYEPIINLFLQDSALRNRELIAFATFENLRKLKINMPVQVSPTDLPREKYGYMKGKITDIARYPLSKKEALDFLKVESFVNDIFPANEPATFIVRILLDEETGKSGQILWSHARQEKIKISTGTFCDIQITTKRMPVYQKLFEEVHNKVRTTSLWFE